MSKPLTQIALRLPASVMVRVRHLVEARRKAALKADRWADAQAINQSTVIREAIQRGLSTMNENDSK
jgi:hypothetical protein